MRICLLCDAQSIHFQRWAGHLRARGHTVKIYSQQHQDIQGVQVSSDPLPKAPFPLLSPVKKLFKALYRILKGRRLRGELKAFRPQVVHAHFLTDSGWISSWTGYHPLIMTAHGSDVLVHPRHSRIDNFIARFCVHRADIVTTVARHMQTTIQRLGCPPGKILYLPNFVDTQLFNMSQRPRRDYLGRLLKPVIVSARSLKPVYHVGVLINAIPFVLREIPDARFIVIGEGSERSKLIDRARQLQIEEYVEFLPHQSHERIAEIFREADIYVSTSRSDGLCVSLLEAMASGLYPIVTDIPGSREVIADGRNGSLIPLDDEVALSETIVDTIRRPQQIPAVIQSNHDLIRGRYEEKKVMLEVEELYRRLSGIRSGSRHLT
jgi:glycosyltransferase involved in cell wall biosynthesis